MPLPHHHDLLVFGRLRAGLMLLLFTSATARPQGAMPCPAAPSHIDIANGSYSSGPGVTFVLHHFVATLVPRSTRPPRCQEKLTVVSHAEIFVSNDSLTQVFASKLGATDSKIKGLKIENGLDKVTLSGEIVKVLPLKFSIEGPVTTDGTSLQLSAVKIDADGIPIKALLGLIGDHLSSVIGMKGVVGVSVDGNTMTFFPEQIAHLKGHISSVSSSPQGLTLRYDTAPAGLRKLSRKTPGKSPVDGQAS